MSCSGIEARHAGDDDEMDRASVQLERADPAPLFLATTLIFGFAAGVLTSTFQSIAQTYGIGETNPDTNQFEPTGPLSIAIFAVTVANLWVNLALSVKRLHDRDRTG
jgi:uncharacterized membrane protein YhaH (DUF805 family)